MDFKGQESNEVTNAGYMCYRCSEHRSKNSTQVVKWPGKAEASLDITPRARGHREHQSLNQGIQPTGLLGAMSLP